MSIKSSNWTEALKKLDVPPNDELYEIFEKQIEFPYKIFLGKHAGLVKYKSCSPGSAKINGDLIRQEMGSSAIKVKDSIYNFHWRTGHYLEFNDEFLKLIMPWVLDDIQEEETQGQKYNSDTDEAVDFYIHDKFPDPVIDDPDDGEISDDVVIKHMRNSLHHSRTGEFLDEEYNNPCC